MTVSFFIPSYFITDPSYHAAWHEPQDLSITGNREMGTLESWIYQTWFMLKQNGVFCSLVTEPPEEGILIVHPEQRTASFLNDLCPYSSNLFIVDIVADLTPHPAAHLHLVQNKAAQRFLPSSFFMPHWPQPHLIPRNSNRGSRFENISFFGYHFNLATELTSEEWSDQLRRQLGLFFDLQESSAWHDYSEVDCALAIRDFSRSSQLHKPATKLYNAWHAGVPFIGGRDSAYAANGHSGKDYLMARTVKEMMAHLKKLKTDEAFRSRLVAQGAASGALFTRSAVLERWKMLVQEILPSLAADWKKKPEWQRRSHAFLQKGISKMNQKLMKR